MTSPQKFSIPTMYAGTRFRSKLEADYARTFDALGVKWEFEGVAHYFGKTFYYPDFWLPRSRQYVEVKGVFEPNDVKKIRALIAEAKPRQYTGEHVPDIPIVAAMPGGVFFGWERTAEPVENWYTFLTKSARKVELFACTACRGWWFCDPSEGFRCQCCGVWDGNGRVATSIGSPIPEFPNVDALFFLAPDFD